MSDEIEMNAKKSVGEGTSVGDEKVDCRICHEADLVKNLEAPCACNGSLKLAHRACIQRWCCEKKGTTCEICNQPYQAGYTISPPDHANINETDDFVDRDSVFTRDEAERLMRILRYDEYISGARIRVVFALIICLFLIDIRKIRDAFSSADKNYQPIDSIISAFSEFFVLVTPIYIFIWIASFFICRREREEMARMRERMRATQRAVPIRTPSNLRRRGAQNQSESRERPLRE